MTEMRLPRSRLSDYLRAADGIEDFNASLWPEAVGILRDPLYPSIHLRNDGMEVMSIVESGHALNCSVRTRIVTSELASPTNILLQSSCRAFCFSELSQMSMRLSDKPTYVVLLLERH